MLVCEHLSVRYGAVPALRDVSLTVRPDEIVALIGPNGAGKTTSLMTIAGVLRPERGSVSFGGRPLTGVDVTLDADMPSMPKAHNTAPVKAMPGRTSGEYRAQLDLEMLGEWAVRLRLAGPVKDQRILLYDFDEKGARPVRRSGKPPRT